MGTMGTMGTTSFNRCPNTSPLVTRITLNLCKFWKVSGGFVCCSVRFLDILAFNVQVSCKAVPHINVYLTNNLNSVMF